MPSRTCPAAHPGVGGGAATIVALVRRPSSPLLAAAARAARAARPRHGGAGELRGTPEDG